ncbi:DUF4829 domain-containing protein [Clostridium sp. FP2]|uniref:DUF4829 domain-containing protein n=1 Tax=Clostridium sp. FP2 TaxID=2724481 RepID=UPI0013E99959|nr:DUF4829 domain-containing protein [Clostridium sp. FP2]MBZ9626047.1 DUF4829 domain-containing protein [Clostridium sp. FP2]
MKLIYKIVIGGVILLSLILCFVFFSYENMSIKKSIKQYYKVADIERDVDKHNSLVIKADQLKSFDSIPNIIKSRDFLELKEINPQKYPLLKYKLESTYLGKEKNVKFYMIKYDIKFKENSVSPVDSGVYYSIVTLEKHQGTWLLITDTHSASFKNGVLSVDS